MHQTKYGSYMKTDKKPMDVLARLVDRAVTWRFVKGSMTRDGKPKGKPGELIEQCSPEERTLLSNLTSDEALNIRSDLPEIGYVQESPKPNYYVKPK